MSDKTHYDHIERIGGTHATSRNRYDRQWNKYYFLTYQHVVRLLLGDHKDKRTSTVLDVGTSHGNWARFLKREGFMRILGVEIDPERAEQARRQGYDEVFNCDAADTPLKAGTVDVAISNDVFVHVLQLDDKIRILEKIQQLLKPGGCFIVNHTSTRAHYDTADYRISDYCSYISLDEFRQLILDNTDLQISDIRPTYFNWRFKKAPFFVSALRKAMRAPLVPHAVAFLDRAYSARHCDVEDADTFYLKLTKAS